jgi:hypothetical protein
MRKFPIPNTTHLLRCHSPATLPVHRSRRCGGGRLTPFLDASFPPQMQHLCTRPYHHTHSPPPLPPPPPHVHRSTRCGWRTPHTLREVAGSTTMPSLTWSTQVRTGAQGHYKGTACHGLRQTCTIAMQIGTQTAITNVEYTSMRKATAALRHCAALALAHLQCNALAQLRDGFAHERTCGRAHVHL